MAKKTSKVRLQKELKAFVADPPPFIPRVHVNERNILVGVAPATVVGPDPTPPPPPPHVPRPLSHAPNLSQPQTHQEWHLLMEGCPDTPYQGGWYIAKLKFPQDYPFKPPSIFMCTPSGRFATGTRLCLSMSDFHPETWNPGWSVATVAKGLLSFMCEDAVTTGAVVTSAEEKVRLAGDSVAWNVSHGRFKSMFPEIANSSQLDSISEAGKGKKAKEGEEKGEGSGGDLADKVDSLGLD